VERIREELQRTTTEMKNEADMVIEKVEQYNETKRDVPQWTHIVTEPIILSVEDSEAAFNAIPRK
jgi:hypothetical protein